MVDQEKVKEAVSLLLEAIGEDPSREGLKDTPDRIARMYTELLAGMEADPAALFEKTFETNDTEMIIEKDITFHSMCEHHLMPFMGKVHIAYIPDGKVAGLSKLCRIVEVYARRLQLQERMTDQIAEAMMTYLQPKGVLVFTEAEHTCVTMRGIKKPGTITQTYAVRGVFKDNPELQNRAFNLIK